MTGQTPDRHSTKPFKRITLDGFYPASSRTEAGQTPDNNFASESQQISTNLNKHHIPTRIIDFLKHTDDEYNAKTIRLRLGEPRVNPNTLRYWLSKLVEQGQIRRVKRGFYQGLPEPQPREVMNNPARVHFVQVLSKSTNTPPLPLIKASPIRLSLPWDGEAIIQLGNNRTVLVSITRSHPGYRGQELIFVGGYIEGWLAQQGVTISLTSGEVTQSAYNWDARIPSHYKVPTQRLSFEKWFIQQYGYSIGSDNYERLEVHNNTPVPWEEMVSLAMGGLTVSQVHNYMPMVVGQIRAAITEGISELVKRVGGGG